MSARAAIVIALLAAASVAHAQAPTTPSGTSESAATEPTPPAPAATEQVPASPAPADAQQQSSAPPSAVDASASNPLGFSRVDRATVRVLAVRGVGAMRIESDSGQPRMLGVPDAGHGSGLVIAPDGIVLTANHVIEDAALLAVWVPGQDRALPAAVVYRDEARDLAFLAVSGSFEDYVELEPTVPLRVRQQVHAIGYPLDVRRTDPQSSRGIVAGESPDGFIQLDMALNPGNSGGPLIDADERVVGMVVARGNPEAGVQSMGFAVPLAPIAQAYEAHVRAPGALDAAQRELADTARTHEIARLVALLVRVGAVELVHDVIGVLDAGRRSEILERLRALSEHTQDPEVLALLAAYFWDAAAVVLERAGGAMRASQLVAGPERQMVADLMTRAVSLCHRAVSLDPLIARRSPFVARVVYYFDPASAPAVPVPPPPMAAPAPASPPAAAPADCAPSPYRDPRVVLHVGLALLTQPRGGFGLAFGTGNLGVDWSPATLRAGIVAFDFRLGGGMRFGGWGPSFLFGANLDLGGTLRIGDRYGAMIGAAWSPGVLLNGSQATGVTAAGWRAFAGAQIDVATVGLGWYGMQLDGAPAFHSFELFVELGW